MTQALEPTPALEVVVTCPVVSFRNDLYAGLQVDLPCPPPSTVGGMLAATVGGWQHVPLHTRFAMTFRAEGTGVDLETYHPLAAPGVPTNTTIKDRNFLAQITLTLWLTSEIDLWAHAFRRPVCPLRLGRSQDLATARTTPTTLHPGPGTQGHAVLPVDLPETTGTRMRLSTAISFDRTRTRWDTYQYARTGAPPNQTIDAGQVTASGQAVALLPPVHPA
ncbi:CRISPR-associated protein Cas5, partial [Nocardia alni]|uniref:CRISPR-associated protein Cas5 n=1 Tax=Nocardia alni TaxID=2815723 RepID=UPI001C231E12